MKQMGHNEIIMTARRTVDIGHWTLDAGHWLGHNDNRPGQKRIRTSSD